LLRIENLEISGAEYPKICGVVVLEEEEEEEEE
jgi:hypothetical protein